MFVKEIREADVGLNISGRKINFTRKTSRVILLNEKCEVALQWLPKEGTHILPGGGIEKSERAEAAAKREIKEETGFNCEIEHEIGEIFELRNKEGKIIRSRCFFGKIVGEKGETNLTEKEKREGVLIEWKSPGEALKALEAARPLTYKGHFMRARDLEFLKQARDKGLLKGL